MSAKRRRIDGTSSIGPTRYDAVDRTFYNAIKYKGGQVSTRENLETLYRRMFDRFGPQDWWPGETPFEVMVGAVLTQNTSWANVERAIDNLRGAGQLTFAKMAEMPVALLAEYIRPAGYYNLKAARLLNLFAMIRERFDSDIDRMLAAGTGELREALLEVKGIGPETADSILLYAGNHPVFVVDAYTYRILLRHDLIAEEFGYQEIRELFMDNLSPDASLYNEFHALLVCTGKEYCRKSRPRCNDCPLQGL